MDDDATGWSATTEDAHSHFCYRCGGTWEHHDEWCEVGRQRLGYLGECGGDLVCPACQEA